MRTIAIINLKGGVGKTMTALSMAHELNRRHGKKVLLVDNDPQANTTKFFDCHDYDSPSMEHIMGPKSFGTDTRETICRIPYPYGEMDISLIPSNLNLEDANVSMMLHEGAEQNTRLKKALQEVQQEYDFCIIDCPPGIGINVINALCAADDVIIPIKIDKHALDGMQELMEVIEEIRALNHELKEVRCLVTMYQREAMLDAGCKILENSRYACFKTRIRYSKKVVGASFWHKFIADYSRNCAAAVDYRKMVEEYIEMLEGSENA